MIQKESDEIKLHQFSQCDTDQSKVVALLRQKKLLIYEGRAMRVKLNVKAFALKTYI